MNKPNNKTLFVVLEGSDGSGKTTLIKLVQKKLLKNSNYAVLATEEPFKQNHIINLRKTLLKSKEKINSMNETLMFILDRRIHLEYLNNWISEQKEKVKIILCDRYFYSTMVYQSAYGNVSFEQIEQLHKLSDAWKVPDLTFFLTVANKKVLIKRFVEKNKIWDRMHKKVGTKILDVQAEYCKLAEHFKNQQGHDIRIIPVGQNAEIDSETIYQTILNKLNSNEF